MKVSVVAAVLDEKELVLYQHDGTTVTIPQGDRRLKAIMDSLIASPPSGSNPAEVSIEGQNILAEFEAKSKSFGLKFYRVARNMLNEMFEPHKDEVENVPGASFHGSEKDSEVAEQARIRNEASLAATKKTRAAPQALGEGVLKNAVSVQSVAHASKPLNTKDETIVAVTQDGHIVPDIQNIEHMLESAVAKRNPEGVNNLIRRMGKMVADARGHSVIDIMRFLERGDLDVTNSGDIVAYKILKKTPARDAAYEAQDGVYFDCHSGKIPQRVGTLVQVAEHLVDKNRYNECSNGLHIARRGYLGQFSGDVCTMVIIRPEDIITVPHNDPNKVRVCAYLIVAEFSRDVFSVLKSNKAMTGDTVASVMLGKALRDELTIKLETVLVRAHHGGDILITQHFDGVAIRSKELQRSAAQINKAGLAGKAQALDIEGDKKNNAPKVSVKDVRKGAASTIPVKTESRGDKAIRLNDIATDTLQTDSTRVAAAEELLLFKKTAKVSWSALGLDDKTPESLNEVIELGKQRMETRPVKKAAIKIQVPVEPKAAKSQAKTKEPEAKQPAPTAAPASESRTEKAARLWKAANKVGATKETKLAALQELVDFKGKAKVSYEALGLSTTDVVTLKDKYKLA